MISSDFKILIVLPHLTCGGTERTAAEMANYIASYGGNVAVVLMYNKERFYELHPRVNIIEPIIRREKAGKYLYTLYLLFYLRAQFKKQKPDIIFALGYIAFTLLSSLRVKTKVIISFRSSPNIIRFPGNCILNTAYLLAHKLLKGRVEGVIAQTSQAAVIYKNKYNCPVITIPNFLRELKDYKVERENHIINVGHCSFEKGQHYLLKAFAKLNAPNWRLIIVGDGPKRKELEELSNSLEINEKVIFTGYQKDVDFYLSRSKIFALTSIIEGYPNALIEAMATPLTPVSFNCDAGPSDIIKDGENGFLVDVGDVETFADKLQELIDRPELREAMQQKASNIRYENSLSNIAPKYLRFFNDIAQNVKH
jgi:GalNAc-alpha-(1->4)-GalNAc-alpha-(1->3)-diNAcBac-PP-undecaprenol alpha-1,4-N-acetyl-D-galactosaminyltransferase